jgi:hypothetical protein
VTRAGRYREYVWKDKRLPYAIKVSLPPADAAMFMRDETRVSELSRRRDAEFFKIGLTDSFGRPIYVQRW